MHCGVIWLITPFQGVIFILKPVCHYGLALAIKIAIFGPLYPWIGAWKGALSKGKNGPKCHESSGATDA